MWTIFIVQLVGLISPGPDFFYVSRKAMGDSRRNAILASIGISLGIGFWSLVVLFGLSFLNKAVPSFQNFLMVIGGAYLTYSGIKMVKITQNTKLEEITTTQANNSALKEIVNGILINLSNPKVVVFFSSVLAGYVQNLSRLIDSLFVLSILMGSALCYFISLSILLSHKKVRMFYAKYNHYLDNFAGIIFILFGTRLIYEGITNLI